MCANSIEIYDKIQPYKIFHDPIIPEVQVPDLHWIKKIDAKYEALIHLQNEGNLQERYWLCNCLNKLQEIQKYNDEYLTRLNTEADVILFISNKLGNCLFSYFNTFQHYIDLFWECGSLVGPGRGSSCGFLSNYLLGITQLDPIKWNLPWFRFLNKERAELPN